MKMKYFIDERGHCRVKTEKEHSLISSFLEEDIQSSLYGVNEYISACESVNSGYIPEWKGTGNAHTITIKQDGVEIFNEYTEESLTITTIEKFKGYLEK
ncbi:YacL family protein [Serratia rubidaea]|uniref:YacL family protein n=1 Tax=Serratia rubidaea TaxID=61652 RepID=UPI00325FD5DC